MIEISKMLSMILSYLCRLIILGQLVLIVCTRCMDFGIKSLKRFPLIGCCLEVRDMKLQIQNVPHNTLAISSMSNSNPCITSDFRRPNALWKQRFLPLLQEILGRRARYARKSYTPEDEAVQLSYMCCIL